MNIPPGIYRLVSKNGLVSYRVRIRIKNRRPVSKTFKNLSNARKWKRITEAAIEKEEYLDTLDEKKETLFDAIEKYIREIVPNKPKNADAVTRHLERWSKELGSRILSKIKPSDIAAVRDKLLKEKTDRNKNRNPATVVRYLASLSHLFSIAVKEWEWVGENPVFKVTKPKESSGRLRYLSKEEIQTLLSHCKKSDNPHLFTIVLIALQTAMRKAEILSLRWEDIDFDNKSAYLRETKNGSPRIVPFTDKLIERLKNQTLCKTGLMFPSPNNIKKPIDFRSAWMTVLKKAGITNFHFHDLRHTAASYLAMADCGYGQLGEILGHKSPHMTKRYAHLSIKSKKEKMQVLEDLCFV